MSSGNEILNIITNNVIIRTLKDWNINVGSTKPASFYISNPNNYFENNRAPGGDYAGVMYNIYINIINVFKIK